MGIDAVIRRKDGTFIEVQIKARSDNTRFGDSGLFTVNKHENFRKNYFFVFYSTRLNTKWILNSDEFVKESLLVNNGKNKGMRQIWFTGKNTKEKKEFTKPKFEKYIAHNFERLG
jgi:hypothetical protein